jgi:hypothetical protein
LEEQEWLRLSLAIRREHECTHYFTRHVFSSMRNNLLDELIADYMGVTASAGRFRSGWLLWFFGLESFPIYREGARLQNYRGNPPLSDRAFAVLQKLVVATAANLEIFDRLQIPEFQHARWRPALMKVLTQLTVEELASKEAQQVLRDNFAEALKSLNPSGTIQDMNSCETIRAEFGLQSPALAAMEAQPRHNRQQPCHLHEKEEHQ